MSHSHSPAASTTAAAPSTESSTTTTTTVATPQQQVDDDGGRSGGVSPLALKSGAVLETQSRLLRHLQSIHYRDSTNSVGASDYKTLARVLAQCQTLLTTGSQILQAAKAKAAMAVSVVASGDAAVAAGFAKVKAAVEYACARCDSYAKMKQVIIKQVGPKAWEAHRAFITAEIKGQVTAQVLSLIHI